MKVTDEKYQDPDPDPLVRGMDPLLLATTSTGSWLVAKYLYNNKKNNTL